MKLATKKNNNRDGELYLVSSDLTRCISAATIAKSLQLALDNWSHCEPALLALSEDLNSGIVAGQAFHAEQMHSPLPRAYQWADGSAYVNHVELVRKARGADLPKSFWTDPLMYQGGSDTFLAPTESIPFLDPSYGLDMEGEIAVIVDDVPLGADEKTAAAAIRLIMLVNDISLRGLIPGELAKGFGFFQAKPSTAFSPVAVTPDELGDAWDGQTIHLPLCVDLNGQALGRANAGVDMTFGLPTLIAHAAKTRALSAGTIIGSGTVSNKGEDGSPGKPVADGGKGYSCLAEQRMIETIQEGQAKTPFMSPGDRVTITMLNAQGESLFGAIDQCVVAEDN